MNRSHNDGFADGSQVLTLEVDEPGSVIDATGYDRIVIKAPNVTVRGTVGGSGLTPTSRQL